jgi:hypothetical protein
MVTTEVWVDHGDYVQTEDPACNADENRLLADIAKGLAEVYTADLDNPWVAAMAGELAYSTVRQIQELSKNQPGFVAGLFAPPSSRRANCAPLGVLLPIGATVKEVIYWAGDGDKRQQMRSGLGRNDDL